MKKQVKKIVKPAIQGKTINEALRLLQQQYHHLETVIDGTIDQDIGQLRNDVDQQSARIDQINADGVRLALLEQRLNTEVSAINAKVLEIDRDTTNQSEVLRLHSNEIDTIEERINRIPDNHRTYVIELEDYVINLENQTQALAEALLDCNEQLIDTDGDSTTHWTF